MSVANTGAMELQLTVKYLRDAISDVNVTRSSLQRQYRQLGEGWSDQKYRALGDIVQDCDRALSSMLEALMLGEGAVRHLLGSVQSYEAVSLGTSGGGYGGSYSGGYSTAQSLQREALTVCEDGTEIPSADVLPDAELVAIRSRHQDAETGVRRVFNAYAPQLTLQSGDLPPGQPPGYLPGDTAGQGRGVYCNAVLDAENPEGPGTAYFNGMAHMIDHAAANYEDCVSNTPDFGHALMLDSLHICQQYQQLPAEQQEAFQAFLQTGPAHSMSDLLSIATEGRLGSRSASQVYPENLQSAAFAHFFEASMGCEDKRALLMRSFPTAFAEFSAMIDGMQPAILELVRRL